MNRFFCWLSLLTAFTLLSNFGSAQKKFDMSLTAEGNTRVQIGRTIAFDISGQYPSGAFPGWEKVVESKDLPIVNYIRMATVGFENFNIKNTSVKQVYAQVVLTQKDNIPILIVGDYYAEIDTRGSVMLGNTPQRFQLVNFRSKRTDEPVENSKNSGVRGGAKGTVDLSVNDEGDINLSFVVEYNREANRSLPEGLSFRYSLTDMLCQNLNKARDANIYAANVKKAKTEDSLQTIINQKNYAEQSRLFEIKIKNSLANITQLHKTYNSNWSCLKIIQEERIVQGNKVTKSYPLYKYVTSATGGINQVYMGEQEVTTGTDDYTASYEVQKNNCAGMVIIKGITKRRSSAGTIYYEDASIKLMKNETTDELIKIENDYNATLADINSTHYYKNKIIAK